jgi:putative ABC transport system permease protein
MFKNYLKITIRYIIRNRVYSFINIIGLAIGMAVALLIGLWILDELSYNASHKNHDNIAKVMLNQTFGDEIATQSAIPMPLGKYLRTSYGSDFKRVVLSSWNQDGVLAYNDDKYSKKGSFMDKDAPDLLSLQMLSGRRDGLADPHSILISASLAKTLFGNGKSIGKVLKLNNKANVTVTGVYEDIAYNSSFNEVSFIAPWELYLETDESAARSQTNWGSNSFQIFVELNPNSRIDQVNSKIKNAIHVNSDSKAKPVIFLYPMNRWNLYSEFKNGINTGGRIQFVWLFGIIGVFVLILACINFVNLSTARAEKRAKEVGIRKTIGSSRKMLIGQFLMESLLTALLGFLLAGVITILSLHWFNDLADKKISIPWGNGFFWLSCLAFILFTGFAAGCYPAYYLSSFQPVKVLKGTFVPTNLAVSPRKILVVLQFTVSITLIICTVVVFQQIRFAQNRPIGYSRDRLIYIPSSELIAHYDVVKEDLIATGAVESILSLQALPQGFGL